MKNSYIIIVVGCCLGAYIGSKIGIVAMGGGIAGTLPGFFIGGYLAYRISKKLLPKMEPDAAMSPALIEQEPLEAIEESVSDSVPLVAKFLGASWNIFMKLLIYARIMHIFKRTPWLMIALVLILMAIAPPIGIFLCVSGFVASHKGASSENNFMMPLK